MIPPESRFLQEKKYNIEKQIEQKSSHTLMLTKTNRSERYRENSQIRRLCQLQLIAVYRPQGTIPLVVNSVKDISILY